MGRRAPGLILLAGAVLLTVAGRGENVSTRPPCVELSGWCVERPVPVPAPTSSYDGRGPQLAADRRPIEQNPTCWITNPGWPYNCERTDTP